MLMQTPGANEINSLIIILASSARYTWTCVTMMRTCEVALTIMQVLAALYIKFFEAIIAEEEEEEEEIQ